MGIRANRGLQLPVCRQNSPFKPSPGALDARTPSNRGLQLPVCRQNSPFKPSLGALDPFAPPGRRQQWHTRRMPAPTRLILDCDPGHDDALAILVAAGLPGVTICLLYTSDAADE